MGILKLPTEILLEILDLLRPYGFEGLGFSCKQLYDVIFMKLMPRHLEFRKKYHTFKFGLETVQTIPELLKEIADNPIIASYIIHADLSDREYPDPGDGPYRYPDGIPDSLVELVRQSKHLAALSSGPEFLEFWLKGIVGEFDIWDYPFDFQTAFLLTFLTNVESLILPPEWNDRVVIGEIHLREPDEGYAKHRVSDLIQRLSINANDPSLENQPLQKLRVLHPTHNIDQQSGKRLEAVFPFLALNSLREVYYKFGVYEPGGGDDNQGVTLRYPTLLRNVEVVKMYNCVMSGDGAGKFFKDMHQLRLFEFEYSMKDEIGWDWHAGTFVWYLKRHVGRHLEHLSITTDICMEESEPITFSLRGFKKLGYLKLSTELFNRGVGPGDEIESGSRYGENDDHETSGGEGEGEDNDYDNSENNGADDEDEDIGSEDGERETGDGQCSEISYDEQHQDAEDGESTDESDENNDEFEVWRLVDRLPSSLHTLEIVSNATSLDCKCLEWLFDGFEDRKDACLPLLKNVTVHVRRSFWASDQVDDIQAHFDRAAAFFNTMPTVTFQSQ